MLKNHITKLLKTNAVALVYSRNGAKVPIVRVIGVFKNKRFAQKYLDWLKPTDLEKFRIVPTKKYTYTTVYEGQVEKK